MNIDITNDGLDGDLAALVGLFEDPGERSRMFHRGGRAVQQDLRAYHRDFEAARKWTNPRLPTHGAGRRITRFGEDIARAWSRVEADSEGVSVINTDPRLGLKVHGGTIRPRRASKLTIPVDPRAHGRSTRQFRSVTGLQLFRPRGKDWLAVNEGGKLKLIYLLKDSMTYKPWKGALPSNERLLDAFTDEVLDILDEAGGFD